MSGWCTQYYYQYCNLGFIVPHVVRLDMGW